MMYDYMMKDSTVRFISAIIISFVVGAILANHLASTNYQPRIAELESQSQQKDGQIIDLKTQLSVEVSKYNVLASKTTDVASGDDTYVIPSTQPSGSGCPITTCRNNTCSNSVGKGTCSWNRGIAN